MKYQTNVTVNVPLTRFVELLDNPENMQYWQDNLISYEMLEGEPGKVGSTMQLNYIHGKREMSLIETIVKNELPHEFNATYTCPGTWNMVENRFYENEQGQTVWESDCEFRFTGLMRIMSWFMPKSMFQKETRRMLDAFRDFAEHKS